MEAHRDSPLPHPESTTSDDKVRPVESTISSICAGSRGKKVAPVFDELTELTDWGL